MSKIDKKKKIRVQKTYMAIKILCFSAAMLIFALIGLLLPLRPKQSVIEKRELEHFPSFTFSGFWDGSFFSGVSTWYADTFPFREKLISANSGFKSLYGIKGEQIVGDANVTADAIPQGGLKEALANEAENENGKGGSKDPGSGEEGGTEEAFQTETAEPETEEETYEDGAIHVAPEMFGSVYVAGDAAFGIYGFVLDVSNRYIKMIDKAAQQLDGIATVYDVVVPTNVGIMLDEAGQAKIGSSSQKDAINYICEGVEELNDKVVTVNTYQNILNHNSEYIYFRTDHHWTALGAYYAYESFCKAKGITPHKLTDFETMEFPNFLGTLYASSGQVASLREHPDTVTAYIPNGTNDMVFTSHNLVEYPWRVVNDVSDYPNTELYATFAAGDQVFAHIDNPAITDGSACVVIKESYGNAFIPFLVDHYEHVYIIDYRYFYKYPKYGNSLVAMVKDCNVKDVIFVNNISATSTDAQVSHMESMLN